MIVQQYDDIHTVTLKQLVTPKPDEFAHCYGAAESFQLHYSITSTEEKYSTVTVPVYSNFEAGIETTGKIDILSKVQPRYPRERANSVYPHFGPY